MADPRFRLCVNVYEINKVTHGRLKIWSLSFRVQFDLPLVADQTEHSKINSISPHTHMLFSIYQGHNFCSRFHISARPWVIFYRSIRSNVLQFVFLWRFADISLFAGRSISAKTRFFESKTTQKLFTWLILNLDSTLVCMK